MLCVWQHWLKKLNANVLQIAKSCSPLSKEKQHLGCWRWFSKKKSGVKVYTSSLKFSQSMLLHCSCQHCPVPQAPHRIWLHSAARFSLLTGKYHLDKVPIGYRVKRGNIPLCSLGHCRWFGMSMTFTTRLEVESHRSAVKAHTSPYCILLFTVLWCSMEPADKTCFAWISSGNPQIEGNPTRNGSKANLCLSFSALQHNVSLTRFTRYPTMNCKSGPTLRLCEFSPAV